jgi:hypothetical protein
LIIFDSPFPAPRGLFKEDQRFNAKMNCRTNKFRLELVNVTQITQTAMGTNRSVSYRQGAPKKRHRHVPSPWAKKKNGWSCPKNGAAIESATRPAKRQHVRGKATAQVGIRSATWQKNGSAVSGGSASHKCEWRPRSLGYPHIMPALARRPRPA